MSVTKLTIEINFATKKADNIDFLKQGKRGSNPR